VRQRPPAIPPPGGGTSLSREEISRYQRHLMLPEVGPEGQARLRRASVLLVGMGGLGSPAALYLAAAGVGRLGLVDDDLVDETNLQRQVLYGTSDVGRVKVEAAAGRLSDVNPLIEIEPHPVRLTSEGGAGLAARYDIVLDGTDNFTTRYLLNDLCVQLDKPLVSGSLHRFDGQISVFWASHGPCYRCLFPDPPPPDRIPNCAEAGVLGVLPGLVGVLQATEAIKIAMGIGDVLIGRLLTIDAMTMSFSEFEIPKDPACPSCGPERRFSSPEEVVEEVPAGCGPLAPVAGERNIPWEVGPEQVKRRLAEGEHLVLLDVREHWEWELARIEGAISIPLSELPRRLDELDPEEETIVICKVGERSAWAVGYLRRTGYSRAVNLRGGIVGWQAGEPGPLAP